jgi:ABC-2 type transport system ATP-binding protein
VEPPAKAAEAVRVEALRVRRGGHPVLDGLSLAVPRGRVVGLLGPSGSGKTTLMRAIVGVQVCEGGRVTVLGTPAGSPGLRSRVAYMAQGPSVYGDLEVGENLAYFARVLGVARDRVAEVLDAIELQGLERQLVANLSGGERARVSLGLALLGEPELLVLDEPTVGLDPVLRRRLWRTFHSLSADGLTLLVSSHVMEEAERCDELLLMRDGRILAQGSPRALMARTRTSDIEAAFLALVEGCGAGA